MDSFDLVIRGGTVVTSSETSRCDVGIRDGRIAALAEAPRPPAAGKSMPAASW